MEQKLSYFANITEHYQNIKFGFSVLQSSSSHHKHGRRERVCLIKYPGNRIYKKTEVEDRMLAVTGLSKCPI